MEEIPNNHRLDVKKPIMNGISTTNLNFCGFPILLRAYQGQPVPHSFAPQEKALPS